MVNSNTVEIYIRVYSEPQLLTLPNSSTKQWKLCGVEIRAACLSEHLTRLTSCMPIGGSCKHAKPVMGNPLLRCMWGGGG